MIGGPSVTFVLAGSAAGSGAAAFTSLEESGAVLVLAADAARPIADAVNALLDSVTTEYVCIVTDKGKLTAGAIVALETALADRPGADVWYTDETIAATGGAVTLAKPISSPERLRCQFYWGNLVVYRHEFLRSLNGLRDSLPGAELYDLALRATRTTLAIEHLDRELFVSPHGIARPLGVEALISTKSALEEHLAETGGGIVRAVGADGIHDTRREVKGKPLVSIVIPTRGIHVDVDGRLRCFVVDALRSIIAKSTYEQFEFVIVVDKAAEPGVLAEIRDICGERLRFVEWDRPFNFSDKVNLGVLHASGEYLLILNDDIEVITPDWIEALLALAQLPDAGMSGAMLYYEDDTIQHAGHAYWRGDASHIGLDAPRGAAGPFGGYRVEREVAGVTAACAMMSREVYFEVGGFSSLLPGAFNDVDLCMKTTWRGHRIYWTPHAELYHFESKSRDPTVRAFEVHVTWGRWGFRMHDPRYWPYPLNRPAR